MPILMMPFIRLCGVAQIGLRDAMDLAYLSAQMNADVLRKFSRTDLKDRQLTVIQNKTGKRLRVQSRVSLRK